jgi:hypothetical protein
MSIRLWSGVLLLLFVVAGVVAAPPEKQLLGKWETTDPDNKQKITLDFMDKNILKIGIGAITIEARYKFLDDDNIELTMAFPDMTDSVKVKIKVDDKELVFSGASKDVKPTKFTRPK